MKILLVSHQFPPVGSAGTETYTADLAHALASRGHAAEVFASVKDIARTNFALSEREHRGIRVHEVTNNLFHTDFRATWDEPRIDAVFAALLDRLRPDVVHFQHLLYLSAGCVAAVHARDIPIVFTLHDYWLQCPRFGQRVHADGGLCDTIDFARCGTCLSSFKYAQTPLERRIGGAIAKVHEGTGINLAQVARGAAGALAGRQRKARGASVARGAQGARGAQEAPPDRAREFAEAARERTRSLRERVIPLVDRFLAPSRFLRDRFVDEWGVPPERIEHLPFGVDLEGFGARPRTRAEKVRVAFLGSLIPVKGAHLLLEAWGRLAPELRARAELSIAGPGHYDPAYRAQLVRDAAPLGVEVGEALPRERVAEKLASTDLLVVPSLWYENSPLVILEGIAAKTPLLVADLGGMAELVEPGQSGWHFRFGDAGDLARALGEVIAEPSALAGLYRAPLALPTFAAHVTAVEARYASLRGEHGGKAGGTRR